MNHFIKNIINLLLVIIFVNTATDIFSGNNYWLRQQSPTHADLKRCAFADTMNIWAVGDSGVIIYTSNGGVNWIKQNSNISSSIEDVFFINKRLGWALSNDFFGLGTLILKTTNGGMNWTNYRYPDTTFSIHTVYFVDSLNGYFGGALGTVLKTTNAGNSWIRCRLQESSFFHLLPILRFHFLNNQNGLAVGGSIDIAGLAWKTTDNGYNWALTDTTPEPLVDVINYNSTLAFTSGGDYEFGSTFSYSFNSGSTWVDSSIGYFGIGRRIAIRKITDIWIPTAFSTEIIRSSDSGKSWISYPIPDTNSVYDAIFTDTSKGWAFGDKGAIYKFNNGIIGIEPNQNNLPSGFSLKQNYPNPFNPETKIEYSIKNTSDIKIILYDMLGREVKVLLNSRKTPGHYELKFNADELSSGVYFYKMITVGFSDSKKLVIIK